jgi:multicomponent Na+:H+ antiporter subunit A
MASFGEMVEVKLMIWHGFNLPLLLSGITLIGGFALYKSRRLLWHTKLFRFGRWTADGIYDMVLDGILGFARWQTRVLQNGYLRNYLLVILGSTGALLVWQLVLSLENFSMPHFTIPGPLEMMVIPLMMVAAIVAVISNGRLTALISLGFVGFGIAFLFALLSAPDLAITQVLVETLVVVLFMFVVYKLPKFRRFSSKRMLAFDAVFAGLFGLLMTFLVLKAMTVQLGPPLSERLAEWSYLLAKGKNVVNVILVDFRALDTLGEITVLTIAALGIYALVSRIGREPGSEMTGSLPEPDAPAPHPETIDAQEPTTGHNKPSSS